MRFVLPFALALFCWHAATAAENETGVDADGARKRMEELEHAIEKGREDGARLLERAERLSQEAESLRAQTVARARGVQILEREMARLEARLETLAADEAAAKMRLRAREGEAARVLMALERLARHPPEALIAHPAGPSDTVRSAILLRAAVPAIERRARTVREALAALRATRAEAEARRTELAAKAAALETDRRHLESLIARKGRLYEETIGRGREIEDRTAAMAQEAESLADLLARLEVERAAREKTADERQAKRKATARAPAAAPASSFAGRSFTAARGRLPLPAVGRVVGNYGQPTPTGLTRKGIAIETAPGATVVAPHDGQVVFAGPFRGYGLLLIIEHGEGYHSLLAGMARIDGAAGQRVAAGEPVGAMGAASPSKPVLYVEFRRNGQPINPLPWLAAIEEKVSG